jgi:ribosomal protein S12 methylthiotransferase accessory factor
MTQKMSVSFPGGKRVEARYGEFRICTDQRVKDGGRGSAPEPYDYFLASLATCAGAYALGFCQRRNLATEGLRVVLNWQREEKTRRMTTIAIRVETPPDFPVKYLRPLERAVNSCAVKKTILDPPEFVVEATRG